MAQFHLQSKMNIDNETIVSIVNSYHNKAFPYWISNPTGAKITKVKIMLGYLKTNVSGGTIAFKLYKTSDAQMPVSSSIESLDKETIENTWTLLTEMDYTSSETEVDYATDYKIVDIDTGEDCFIIGTVDIIGDISAANLFVWVEYENNVVE